MKVPVRSLRGTTAVRRTLRPTEARDKALVALMRPFGVGVSALLRHDGLASIHTNSDVVVPVQFPLAIVPYSSAVTAATAADDDTSFLHPSAEVLSDVCLALGHAELTDVFSLSVFLALQLSTRESRTPLRWQWYRQLITQRRQCTCSTADSALFRDAVRELWTSLKADTKVAVPSCASLMEVAEYLCSAVTLLDAPPPSPDGNTQEICGGPTGTALIPFLDCIANRFREPDNVDLALLRASDVRQLLDSDSAGEYGLVGARQHLPRAKDDDAFWVVASTRVIGPGERLVLRQPFPDGEPESWSPFERLHFRVPLTP